MATERLVLNRFAVIVFCAMTLWPVRKVLTVLLAVLVTTGLSLSVAQASDMAHQNVHGDRNDGLRTLRSSSLRR